jgi:hypothetical protein
MMMDDPSFMTTTGAPWNLPIPAESTEIQEYLYMHMWVSFWAGNYVVGEMTRQAITETARNELFNSNAGRAYWIAIRQNLLDTTRGRYHRFTEIVDGEFRSIIANNIPVADPITITNHSVDAASPQKRIKEPMLVGAALLAGVLAGLKLSQWNRRA